MANFIAAALAGLLPFSSLLPASGSMDWGSSSISGPERDEQPSVTDPAPAPAESEIQKEMREALNRYREDNGVAPVKALTELNVVAQDWAEKMAKDDKMRHNPLYTASYPRGWMFAGENVAQNWEGVDADDLVAQWAESEGHRRNMLDTRFTHAGFGFATTEDGKVYAVQDFAQYNGDPVDGPPISPFNPGSDDKSGEKTDEKTGDATAGENDATADDAKSGDRGTGDAKDGKPTSDSKKSGATPSADTTEPGEAAGENAATTSGDDTK